MSLTCSLYNNAFYRKKAKLKSSASEVQKNVLGFLLAGLKAIASMCDIIQKWSNPAQKWKAIFCEGFSWPIQITVRLKVLTIRSFESGSTIWLFYKAPKQLNEFNVRSLGCCWPQAWPTAQDGPALETTMHMHAFDISIVLYIVVRDLAGFTHSLHCIFIADWLPTPWHESTILFASHYK